MILQAISRNWFWAITPAFAALGYYLDGLETKRLSNWKNKTQLYRRELKEGEDPWK